MLKNFIDPTKTLLKDAFEISEPDALRLALSGMKDLWGYSDFGTLIGTTYGLTFSEIDSNYDKYTKGTGGTKCN